MKKNKMMRIASVLLVAVLLSTCAVSGTFAKYTTQATGSSTATIAKWSVNMNNLDTASQTFTFDLFTTIKDTDLADTNEDDQVAPGKIAPGTQGEFTINRATNSEVVSTYAVDFTVSGSTVPLEFSFNGTDWSSTLSDITATNIPIGAQTIDINVMWRWAFDAVPPNTNAADTALGTSGGTITVTAVVTVDQVN